LDLDYTQAFDPNRYRLNVMHLPLSKTEIRYAFLASQRILQAGNIEDLRRETLLTLQNLFRAEKGNFILTNGDGPQAMPDFDRAFGLGISDKNLRLFRQYYHQLDPFGKFLKKQERPPQSLTFEDVIPFTKLVKTEYYKDFLKPQNIHDQLSIYLMSGNQFLGAAVLLRPKSSPVFSSADKAKAKLIAPILTAALERAISIKKNRELEQAIHSIALGLPYEGIAILDQSLTLVYCNGIAAEVISQLHRLHGQHRSFPPDLPDVLHTPSAELIASIKSSEPNELPCIELSLFTMKSGKKVNVHIRVLFDEKNTPLILICFNPNNQTVKAATSLKQRGISPRELEIIHLLAEGKKNSEIAKLLFISKYTVENHLRSVYRKMDVKNRTALVHKVYTAP
jgi:DNA-binding CsgD family transcriptional regulator